MLCSERNEDCVLLLSSFAMLCMESHKSFLFSQKNLSAERPQYANCNMTETLQVNIRDVNGEEEPQERYTLFAYWSSFGFCLDGTLTVLYRCFWLPWVLVKKNSTTPCRNPRYPSVQGAQHPATSGMESVLFGFQLFTCILQSDTGNYYCFEN